MEAVERAIPPRIQGSMRAALASRFLDSATQRQRFEIRRLLPIRPLSRRYAQLCRRHGPALRPVWASRVVSMEMGELSSGLQQLCGTSLVEAIPRLTSLWTQAMVDRSRCPSPDTVIKPLGTRLFDIHFWKCADRRARRIAAIGLENFIR